MPGSTFSERDLLWRFAVEQAREGAATVVTVHGRIGFTAARPFAAALSAAAEAGPSRLVVDLSGVDYVSSGGLVAIEAAVTRAAAAGGSLVLCGVQDAVLRVLELSGTLARVPVAPTRADAQPHRAV